MDDLDTFREHIHRLKHEIDDERQQAHEKVERIRSNASEDEIYIYRELEAGIEPMRRQLEAMIKALADHEGLKAIPPIILPADAIRSH